jgi:hypothetical protein
VTLLEQIAALGDDAFIAWERLVDAEPDVLDRAPCLTDIDVPHVRSDHLDDDASRWRPFVIRGGFFLAVFVEEVGAWAFRQHGDENYWPMEDRARALLAAAREAA